MRKIFAFLVSMLVIASCTDPFDKGSADNSGESVLPSRIIYYTSSDGDRLFPKSTEHSTFGAVLLSNTYEDGKGILTFDNDVTSIGESAFEGCSGLTSITIPNSVTSIGSFAFCACSGLTSITIPNSVTSIGDYAFHDCPGLTSVTIGNSVTSIGIFSFWGCTGLTSVTIPNSVTSIGRSAFCACSGLTSITIPNSVTSIGKYAFKDCTGLESIVVDPGNTKYDNRDNCNAIIETESNTLITGCKNTVIPNSVTSIGDCAFHSCSGLTSITIPNSVTSIGEWAFYGCEGLKEVHITDLNAWKDIDFEGYYANPLYYGKAKLYLNGVEVTDY